MSDYKKDKLFKKENSIRFNSTKMVYINNWEEFSKSVQSLYDMDPIKVGKIA